MENRTVQGLKDDMIAFARSCTPDERARYADAIQASGERIEPGHHYHYSPKTDPVTREDLLDIAAGVRALT